MPSPNRVTRQALWKLDPKCVLCKVVTREPLDVCKEYNVRPTDIYNGTIPPEVVAVVATLDHVRKDGKVIEERLTCHKCNQNREDGPGFHPRAFPKHVADPERWRPKVRGSFFDMNFWTLVSMGLLAVMAFKRG